MESFLLYDLRGNIKMAEKEAGKGGKMKGCNYLKR